MINKITPDVYKAIIAIVDERIKELRISREDFRELKGTMEELAQAQARTEKRVEELAQAQARTEKRVEELAQAQARTEKRVEELAQAQARTEEEMRRLEEAMRELAQAQAKTERSMREMRKEIGGLSAAIGFGLEDIARVVLPGYLERHYNIYVAELRRKFFKIDEKTQVEINLYGEGRKDGEKIVILGETKSKIYEGEVKKFLHQISPITPQVKGEILKVMFGYLIHPSASELAKKEGVILVASYQR